MSAETRTLCVLFADVAGSTSLYEKLGDAEAKRAIERCLNRVERASTAYRGRVVKTIGDEAMVAFATAEEGLLAASEMQQKIEALPPVSGNKLAIRVGFCAGEVIEQNGDVFGDTVNTAARFVALAKPGQVITGAGTVKQLPLPCLASVRQLDSVNVKGKLESVQLWEVLWRGGEELTLVPNHFAPTRPMEIRLRLRHGGEDIFVSEKRATLLLGRDVASDMVIRDPRASRSHARIELRRDKFVLVDQSTNGTFIATESEGSYAVRREETILRGRGTLTFGHAYQEDIPDFVDYVVLE